MAIYSGAKLRNIPPGASDPAITAIGAILHVDAANSGSLFSYFNGPSGGIESHFFVRKDGVVEQYRDTKYEADANYHANSFEKNGKLYGYISIETQGLASGEWNDAQLREIKKLLLWLSKTHGFPLKKCASSTDPGVGWHVMWGAPGPWTPVAKVCPGPDRVKQFNNVLVPWFKTATEPDQEEDMPLTEAEWTRLGKLVYQKNSEYAVNFWVEQTGTGTALRKDVAAIKASIDPVALAAAIVAKLPVGAVDQAAVEAGVRAVLKEGTDG